MNPTPYNNLSAWMRKKFGRRVRKVSIDAGLTCPNRDGARGTGGCVYCEPATLRPEGAPSGPETVASQIEDGIERVKEGRGRAEGFVAYFQSGSNTYAPVSELAPLFETALDFPEVVGLAVATRPDCVTPEAADLLANLKERKHLWCELGLQTAKDETLGAINRGHTAEEFEGACGLLRSKGIDVCAHVILGLPGEDMDDYLGTMDFLNRLGVWGVKFHQLQVLRGTALEKDFKEGRVRTLALNEYAEAVAGCLAVLRPDVVIHRLSADAPDDWLVAPRWEGGKFAPINAVRKIMGEKGLVQGSVLEGVRP